MASAFLFDFTTGVYELRRDQSHVMTLFACKCTAEHALKLINDVCLFAVNVSSLLLRELRSHEHLAHCDKRYEAKGRLAQIDVDRVYLRVDDVHC
jgi:hypothetical protein